MSEATAKKPIWKRWWFWLLAIIVIGAIGANSGGNTDTETANAPAQEQQQEQSSDGQQTKTEEKKEQAKEYKVGDVVPVEKFEYKVNSIKTAKKIGNEFVNKKTDGQFLIINVTVTNKDNESRVVDTSLFKIIDSQGREFEPLSDGDVYVNEGSPFIFEEVNPNLSRKGNIVFEMPQDAKGLKLEVNSGVGFAAGKTAIINLGR